MSKAFDEAREKVGLALDIGASMLEAGAEINRAEESVTRICRAFGAIAVEVYAMNYAIMVTASMGDVPGITETRRILGQTRNLTRLSELNGLSREICNGCTDVEKVKEKMQKINETEDLNLIQLMMIYALISASFAVFFGGSFKDAILSGVIGVLVAPIDRLLTVVQLNRFVRLVVCSLFCGLVAAVSFKYGMDISTDMVGIGNIMVFIPGVLFTYAVQEILADNMLSGFSKVVESVAISLMIAAGFTIIAIQLL